MRLTLWKVEKNEYGFAVNTPAMVAAVEIPNGVAKPEVIMYQNVAYVPSNHPSRYIVASTFFAE